jgi:hypothetical protein
MMTCSRMLLNLLLTRKPTFTRKAIAARQFTLKRCVGAKWLGSFEAALSDLGWHRLPTVWGPFVGRGAFSLR